KPLLNITGTLQLSAVQSMLQEPLGHNPPLLHQGFWGASQRQDRAQSFLTHPFPSSLLMVVHAAAAVAEEAAAEAK
ncbi:UNVERIFIED_CONTAM: hypothetical protein K2H54_064142, partial [Gekko kuhli]